MKSKKSKVIFNCIGREKNESEKINDLLEKQLSFSKIKILSFVLICC